MTATRPSGSRSTCGGSSIFATRYVRPYLSVVAKVCPDPNPSLGKGVGVGPVFGHFYSRFAYGTDNDSSDCGCVCGGGREQSWPLFDHHRVKLFVVQSTAPSETGRKEGKGDLKAEAGVEDEEAKQVEKTIERSPACSSLTANTGNGPSTETSA